MKTSELIKTLVDSLTMNGDLPVHAIFNGVIDNKPEVNVADGIVYFEGATEVQKTDGILKLTMEVSESDIFTIDEIVKKLGLEKFCQKQVKDDPTMFEFKDEDGEGTFDVETGDVCYDGGETYNYYEAELGSYSLAEALDIGSLAWGVKENGEKVAFWN